VVRVGLPPVLLNVQHAVSRCRPRWLAVLRWVRLQEWVVLPRVWVVLRAVWLRLWAVVAAR